MFEGIFKNWVFIFIVSLIVIVQFALVEFGGIAVKCTPLSIKQHIICILLGAGSTVVCLISKILPEKVNKDLRQVLYCIT